MPIRCPLPQVNRPSIARTPVDSGSVDSRASAGSGGGRLSDVRSPSAGCGRPSMALPSASITRPSNSGPTRSQCVVRTRRTRLPRRTPPSSLKRVQNGQVVAESDHLGPQRRARLPLDLGHGAHRRRKTGRRNRRADRPRHAARERRGHDAVELFDEVGHESRD